MPETPHVSVFTRYVLENPWPVGIGLIAVAMVMLWLGMRDGLAKRLRIGAAFAVAGVVIIVTGILVVTSGERARDVVTKLCDAAIAGNSSTAIAFFSPNAVFSVGSPRNPGLDYEYIRTELVRLIDQYRIEENSISDMEKFSETSTAATVYLACWTQISGYPYPAASQWLIRVERESDGEWRITRLTCIKINGQQPSLGGMR